MVTTVTSDGLTDKPLAEERDLWTRRSPQRLPHIRCLTETADQPRHVTRQRFLVFYASGVVFLTVALLRNRCLSEYVCIRQCWGARATTAVSTVIDRTVTSVAGQMFTCSLTVRERVITMFCSDTLPP